MAAPSEAMAGKHMGQLMAETRAPSTLAFSVTRSTALVFGPDFGAATGSVIDGFSVGIGWVKNEYHL
jgi:hypothetical protein